MDAPNEEEVLVKFLDFPQASSAIVYAVWRLEHLLCEGSAHFADEYLTSVMTVLKNKPRHLRRYHHQSPCELVKRGIFPTEQMLERAGAPAWAER